MSDYPMLASETDRGCLWRSERAVAFRDMDEATIRRYAATYRIPMPAIAAIFWIGVHKVRTGLADLSPDERAISREWLRERGHMSADVLD